MLTAMATLTKPLLLLMQGINVWHRRRMNRAFEEAQTALGERMYATGIDDGEHGAKIGALDEQLRLAREFDGSTQALESTRRELILRLAAAALVDDGPLPGADAEYRRAREAQAALDLHENGVEARRTPSLV